MAAGSICGSYEVTERFLSENPKVALVSKWTIGYLSWQQTVCFLDDLGLIFDWKHHEPLVVGAAQIAVNVGRHPTKILVSCNIYQGRQSLMLRDTALCYRVRILQ